MSVSGIASLSTEMATERTREAVDVAVLKKSMDLQADTAMALIEAMPALPANPNIGRNVNTTA
ncbi:MAG: YjfB family protein [Oxalobacter formigenes]|nr:YjfB family protein [Oxalobacter formigenes]